MRALLEQPDCSKSAQRKGCGQACCITKVIDCHTEMKPGTLCDRFPKPVTVRDRIPKPVTVRDRFPKPVTVRDRFQTLSLWHLSFRGKICSLWIPKLKFKSRDCIGITVGTIPVEPNICRPYYEIVLDLIL